jgi:hypothetical protein
MSIIKEQMVWVTIYVYGTKVGLEVGPQSIVSGRFLSIVDIFRRIMMGQKYHKE